MEGVVVLWGSARTPLEHREESLSMEAMPQMLSRGPAKLASHSGVCPAWPIGSWDRLQRGVETMIWIAASHQESDGCS